MGASRFLIFVGIVVQAQRGSMRVIIVSRDREFLEPLITALAGEDFEVIVVENSAGVQSYLKRGGLQFLIAEASLLVDRGLGREVRGRCPLARLVALVDRPSLPGLVEALTNGLIDYFPRRPQYFSAVLQTLMGERQRLIRWQHTLLSGEAWPVGAENERTAVNSPAEP
jgi:DNA-binding response OmpR family regulator